MARPWRWWAIGALVAGAAGVGLAWLASPATIKLPAGIGSQQQQQPPRGAPPPARPAPAPAPPSTASTTTPPGIAGDRWQALQRELATRRDELQRIDAHLRYADALKRFRADRSVALAQELDAGLDDRLQRREIGAAEARHIRIALLDVLLPDAPSRRAALARWDARHAQPAPADARDARFLQQQTAIVAAWQQQPAEARDPQALRRDLDALRRNSYDTTSTGGDR